MTSTPPPPTGEPLGYPAKDLTLLNQSRQSVIADYQLDFGPWWYVPLLAALFPAACIWLRGEFGWVGVVVGIGAVTSFVAVVAHDSRRRRVRARWTPPSQRNRRGVVLMFLMNFVLISGWIRASLWLADASAPGFLAGMAIGWGLSVAVLTVVRMLVRRERERVLGT